MFRLLDILLSVVGLIICSPLFCFLYTVGLFGDGSPLFFQQRVGKNKQTFVLVKFRTMKTSTKNLASHLVDGASVTKFGKFMRLAKLDELPQLWNVLKGDMSLVGPRPNLTSQLELIKERDAFEVYKVRPGITGLSQLNNIDMSNPPLLARTDKNMIDTLTVVSYFSYIFHTIIGKGAGDRVKN